VHAVSAEQAVPENFPSAPHVQVPPPVYPVLHLTVAVFLKLPVIEPAADLSELSTFVAVHAFMLQAVPENFPSAPHVQVPPPVYPVLHLTVAVSPALPVIEPASDLSELSTFVAVHAFMLQAVPENFPSAPHVQVPPPVYPSVH